MTKLYIRINHDTYTAVYDFYNGRDLVRWLEYAARMMYHKMVVVDIWCE